MEPRRPFPALDAHCPACGQRELYRGYRGVITCGNGDCPNPAAAHQLLGDPHLAEHLVLITERSTEDGTVHHWTLRHPLVERIGPLSFNCEMAHDFRANAEARQDLPPGLYRVDIRRHSPVWRLHHLPNLT